MRSWTRSSVFPNPKRAILQRLVAARRSEAHYCADWARPSTLMALAMNLVRDPRRTPAAKPNDFNPYAPRSKKPILRGSQLEIFRDVFVKNSPGPC